MERKKKARGSDDVYSNCAKRAAHSCCPGPARPYEELLYGVCDLKPVPTLISSAHLDLTKPERLDMFQFGPAIASIPSHATGLDDASSR